MSMTDYLLSIDQGTSSSRAIVFDAQGRVVAVRQKELTLHYPHDGWVEQRPFDILKDTIWAIRTVAKDLKRDVRRIAAAGITNQRETTILWDRKTGEPVYNAIVWQDRRTADLCYDLQVSGVEEVITRKTGLLIDPYFSATKIKWILDHVDGAQALARSGDLAFGTVDTFLLWHLSGGRVHATDATNASRTMLYNIHENKWDKDLLDMFGIPPDIMPDILDNIADFGQINDSEFSQETPIFGMAGDQHAALIGQGCFSPGMVKATYGTGCFALMNTGTESRPSANRLLTTVGYRVDGRTHYALEGSIFNAGTAIQFLRDNLGLIRDAGESEDLARTVEGTNGVYFVPAFTGLGAPFWRPEARAVICGLGRDSQKAHVVRAALEAQGYQTRDLILAMERDAECAVPVVRADGGLTANRLMCEFLSDQLQRRIEVPQVPESTAWGAACLAGVRAGVFASLEDSAAHWQAGFVYEPQMEPEKANALYAGWQRAVEKTV
ncbi:MAG: glycerol kinase GlpK [Alphaproteobacteria bacterium]|nr:glycerol kinase GlpK [Alphaproteobacteria bacterium]